MGSCLSYQIEVSIELLLDKVISTVRLCVDMHMIHNYIVVVV